MKGEIILYQTENGQTKIEVILENETVWLNQYQLEELFQTDRTSILRHIKNIYKTGELVEETTCAKIAQVRQEGQMASILTLPYQGFQQLTKHLIETTAA